jgi:hypothetical protein
LYETEAGVTVTQQHSELYKKQLAGYLEKERETMFYSKQCIFLVIVSHSYQQNLKANNRSGKKSLRRASQLLEHQVRFTNWHHQWMEHRNTVKKMKNTDMPYDSLQVCEAARCATAVFL